MNKEALIKKWLADELTDAELKTFKKLDDYDMHIKILEGAQFFKASDVSEISDISEIYAKVEQVNTKVIRKTNWYTPLFKVAAIFVVLLGVSYFFFMNTDTAIKTLASQNQTILLPDASEVMINSGSEITFNKNNWKDKREVHLEGEAFFKVAKGAAFDVVTEKGTITVLGTQFNVKHRENYFEVKCFEGLVKVKNDKYDHNLPAGSTLRIIDGKPTFETTNSNLPQWLQGISSFKSVPFYEVVNEFERQYDVSVVLENVDTKRIFTGGFVHNDMKNGLKSITLPLDLTFNIDKDNNIILRNKE